MLRTIARWIGWNKDPTPAAPAEIATASHEWETLLGSAQALPEADLADQAKVLVRRSSGAVELHRSWVRQLRYRKAFTAALSVCNAALATDGDKELLCLERGYLLIEANDVAASRKDLRFVTRRLPDLVEARLVLAFVERSLGNVRSLEKQENIVKQFFDPTQATFRADDFDPDAVRSSLAKYGCAWIKRLFDPAELARFDHRISRNLAGVEEVLLRAGAPPGFNVGFPLYFAGVDATEDVHQSLGQSYPGMFDPARMPGRDCQSLPAFVFSQLRRTGLESLICSHLGMSTLYTSAGICHIRNFLPRPDFTAEIAKELRRGLEFHQDNRLYNLDREILTLWFPFRYEHGCMASLEFLPVRSVTHLPCATISGMNHEMFAEETFWRPHYTLGDAVLISGYAPHRTYYSGPTDKERISIDLRFFPTPVPNPITADSLVT